MKKKILIFIITYQASYRLKKVFDSIELKTLKNYIYLILTLYRVCVEGIQLDVGKETKTTIYSIWHHVYQFY